MTKRKMRNHILFYTGVILLCLILLFPLRRLILGRNTETLVLKSAPVVFRRS